MYGISFPALRVVKLHHCAQVLAFIFLFFDFSDQFRAIAKKGGHVFFKLERPELFQLITGSGKLQSILAGLDHAQSLGYSQLKINTVLLREQNADELDDLLNGLNF